MDGQIQSKHKGGQTFGNKCRTFCISSGDRHLRVKVTDILRDRGDRHLKEKGDGLFERQEGQTSEGKR